MKGKKHTEEQIAFALKQAETGVSIGEICRKMGIAESTFYHWKKKFSGLGVSELRRLCTGHLRVETVLDGKFLNV